MYEKVNEIYHHGVLGQKWGVRRYQNPDGSLTKVGQKHLAKLEKKDVNWARKNQDKITSKAYKKNAKTLKKYENEIIRNPNSFKTNGKLTSSAMLAYNQKMADLMNQSVSSLSSPSGKVIKFVAKRGEIGVHMGLADRGYDMTQVKNGVYGTGKVAYKKRNIDMV